MNVHPAPPAAPPAGSLGLWLWLLAAVALVVLWWLVHAFRR
jgi:hypothetical protein